MYTRKLALLSPHKVSHHPVKKKKHDLWLFFPIVLCLNDFPKPHLGICDRAEKKPQCKYEENTFICLIDTELGIPAESSPNFIFYICEVLETGDD